MTQPDINILEFSDTLWSLQNATLVGTTLTLNVGGKATFTSAVALKEIPKQLAFMADCNIQVDMHNPSVYGIFKAMYAEVLDTVTEELVPRNGITILLPLGNTAENDTLQQQGKYTEYTFTIYNKSGQQVILNNIALLRSRIIHELYIDEDGLINTGYIRYVLEVGHTINGTFYFNRSYADLPYYTVPTNPSAVVEPITNAANKYIGGRIIGVTEKTTVVCYCSIVGDK